METHITTRHCPECGARRGEAHDNRCCLARCTVCDKRRATCNCPGHRPWETEWDGNWGQEVAFKSTVPTFENQCATCGQDNSERVHWLHFTENCKDLDRYIKSVLDQSMAKMKVEKSLGDRLIGTDVWDCCGYPITPAMRREALAEFADLFKDWKKNGIVYEQDENGEIVEAADQTKPDMIAEAALFIPLEVYDNEPVELVDRLNDWIATWVYKRWGGEDLMDELRAEAGSPWIDPMTAAQAFIEAWISRLDLDEILEWRGSV